MAHGDDAELLELVVGDIAGGGGCVGRAPDGRVAFVRHSLPGERVVARVTSTTSSFIHADAVGILDPSLDRVTPPCPYAGPGRCGGCDFQHVAPAAQRELKARRVADQLQRVAGVACDVHVEAVHGDRNGLAWRTRVRLAVDPSGHVAFRRHRSHQFRADRPLPDRLRRSDADRGVRRPVARGRRAGGRCRTGHR